LNNAVYQAIRIEIQKCADIKRIVDKLNRENSHKKRLAGFDATIEDSEREIKRISSLRQAVFEDFAVKLLTASEYQYATSKYEAEIEKQTLLLEEAKNEKNEYLQITTSSNKWVVEFSRFMEAKELSSEMSQALIESITISNRTSVDIRFKFRDEYTAINTYTEAA
jgi:hypothetical protein